MARPRTFGQQPRDSVLSLILGQLPQIAAATGTTNPDVRGHAAAPANLAARSSEIDAAGSTTPGRCSLASTESASIGDMNRVRTPRQTAMLQRDLTVLPGWSYTDLSPVVTTREE